MTPTISSLLLLLFVGASITSTEAFAVPVSLFRPTLPGSGSGNANLPEKPVQPLPPQHLSYLGDAIYCLWVRQHCLYPITKMSALHDRVVEGVRASAQGKIWSRMVLEEVEKEEEEEGGADGTTEDGKSNTVSTFTLTSEEKDIARRARNNAVKSSGNTISSEYGAASSLEALIGLLYVKQEWERLEEVRGFVVGCLDDMR
jgi:ribonuclease-3 family protein